MEEGEEQKREEERDWRAKQLHFPLIFLCLVSPLSLSPSPSFSSCLPPSNPLSLPPSWKESRFFPTEVRPSRAPDGGGRSSLMYAKKVNK